MSEFVISVETANGDFTTTSKDSLKSAKRSAAAHVNLRGAVSVAVFDESGNIVFSIPDDVPGEHTVNFMTVGVSSKHEKTSMPTPSSRGVDKSQQTLTGFKSSIQKLANEMPDSIKAKAAPDVVKPNKSTCGCEIDEMLHSAALAISFANGAGINQAKKSISSNETATVFDELTSRVAAGEITQDKAIQILVSKLMGPTMKQADADIKAASGAEGYTQPTATTDERLQPMGYDTISKIRRKNKKGFGATSISNTSEKAHSVLNAVRLKHSDDVEEEPLSIPRGINIYVNSDAESTAVHNVMARHMGYVEGSIYDAHIPSENPNYLYRISLDLTRPTTKHPEWLAAGGRIQHPSKFIQEVKNRVPGARVDTLPGVVYAREF